MGGVTCVGLYPSLPTEADEAHVVGALPVRTHVPAMLVARQDGQPHYLGEVPLAVSLVWRIIEDACGRRHRWWRLEAKLDSHDSRVRPGFDLVVAEHPYGSGWVHRTSFRPGSKKGSDERPHLLKADYASLADVVRDVDQLKYDYWEKGSFLTAGISQPDLPLTDDHRIRNTQERALLVFGVCGGMADLEQALWQTRAVGNLLRATESGRLRFWSPKARFRLPPRLLEDVKAEAPSLMLLAIRQALAGPHRDDEQWIGRPVTAKIDEIYRGHLNRRNRLLSRQCAPLRAFDDAVAYDRGWEMGDEADCRSVDDGG